MQVQGLNNLGDWVKESGVPTITGLIVNEPSEREHSLEPGQGFLKLYNMKEIDYMWWEEQIPKSKNFDWSAFLSKPEPRKELATPARATPAASDLEELFAKVPYTTYRILRDTRIAIYVKIMYD